MHIDSSTNFYIQPTGTSGRLWDVWTSQEASEEITGWLGLVERNTVGFTSQDPDRHAYGPFATAEAAAAMLRQHLGPNQQQ